MNSAREKASSLIRRVNTTKRSGAGSHDSATMGSDALRGTSADTRGGPENPPSAGPRPLHGARRVFELRVKVEFPAAHHLDGYPGDCARPHGHNWGIEVFARSRKLDP